MTVNAFLQKDYENETTLRPKKTNPIQTQFKANLETAPGQKVLLGDYGVLVNWLNGELINWNESNPSPLFYDSAYSQLPASTYSQSLALDCSNFLPPDVSTLSGDCNSQQPCGQGFRSPPPRISKA